MPATCVWISLGRNVPHADQTCELTKAAARPAEPQIFITSLVMGSAFFSPRLSKRSVLWMRGPTEDLSLRLVVRHREDGVDDEALACIFLMKSFPSFAIASRVCP